MKISIVRNLVLLVALVASVRVSSQDILAAQAPMDKQMAMIDSVVLNRLVSAESYEFPADDIYPEWSNEYAHKYENVVMPDSLLIDLTGFCMPTESTKITDIFGYRPRRRRMHYGLDVKVERGDTIRDAFDGKVRYVSYQRRGYGYYVVIRHPNGLETLYAHLTKRLVEENEVVRAGTPIGLGGNTGRSTGAHLHFETRLLGKALNPALMFDFPNQDVTSDFYVYQSKGRSNSTLLAKASQIQGKSSSRVASKSHGQYYKVRKGDSLYVIANRLGTSINQLCKLNRLTKSSKLRPGQILKY
jgi:murein DD-endopeptidase MepM/ murein hydrolase activator NlpD